MAAIVPSRANVRPLPGATIIRCPAASTTLYVGDVVYINTSGQVAQADADDVAQAQARGIIGGIGTKGQTQVGEIGQLVDVVTHGPIELGVTGNTEGAVAYVSPTAGALDQTASVTTGDFNYIVGFFTQDTVFYVDPQKTIPTAV